MGDEVEILGQDVGSWEGEIEAYLPTGVSRSKGAMTARMVGERWLVMDFRNETGFEGHGVYGYDAEQGSYVGTWVDSMRGFLVVGKGTWDPATCTATYRYERTANGATMSWREESVRNPDGTRTYRVIMTTPDGKDAVMMKVLYRRHTGS